MLLCLRLHTHLKVCQARLYVELPCMLPGFGEEQCEAV